MPSILHLTLTHCNSLVTSTLLSVRYYKFHLHATYTPAHTATRHKHGRAISQHRGAEKSVAPTESPTSLWRKAHRIRPNRLGGSGVCCVRVCRGVYDTLNLSYTLGTSVYQLITHKKCKMAVKVHALVYKWADEVWKILMRERII